MFARILETRSKSVLVAVALMLALVFAFIFTGCSFTGQAEAADPEASQAAEPVSEDTVAPPAPEEDGVHAFGETVTWDDNVSLSVSTPAPYTASEYAAGAVEGHQTIAVEFVLTNGSAENFEPAVYGTATSGGVEAPGVFDYDNGMTLAPTTALLPGQTIKWTQAFSVLDPADITLQISAGFIHDDAIFTTVVQ